MVSTELGQLADLRSARARLDEQELTLIDRARHQGATWAQIAEALGLASRQAAEQRRQRLAAAAQARRLAADEAYPPGVGALRRVVEELHRWIGADQRWDSRFARAALVRRTVATALEAPPGPLHSLAAHVAADLAEVDQRRLPPAVRTVAADLHAVLSTPH